MPLNEIGNQLLLNEISEDNFLKYCLENFLNIYSGLFPNKPIESIIDINKFKEYYSGVIKQIYSFDKDKKEFYQETLIRILDKNKDTNGILFAKTPENFISFHTNKLNEILKGTDYKISKSTIPYNVYKKQTEKVLQLTRTQIIYQMRRDAISVNQHRPMVNVIVNPEQLSETKRWLEGLHIPKNPIIIDFEEQRKNERNEAIESSKQRPCKIKPRK